MLTRQMGGIAGQTAGKKHITVKHPPSEILSSEGNTNTCDQIPFPMEMSRALLSAPLLQLFRKRTAALSSVQTARQHHSITHAAVPRTGRGARYTMGLCPPRLPLLKSHSELCRLA